jgi:hypothetical protein
MAGGSQGDVVQRIDRLILELEQLKAEVTRSRR